MTMTKIAAFKIKLRKKEILKILRYDSRYSNISFEIENTIQNQIENAYSLIYPSVIYETFHKSREGYKEIKHKLINGSKSVNDLLKKAYAFSLMIITIGDSLEKEINRIKPEDLTQAYILDAAGSEAVEQAANFVSRLIKEEASKKERNIGLRFSPGYGDWPIETTKNIIEYLDPSKINVILTDDNILIPRKSISAIQPWIK